jgi:two-component system, OmpR family, sensor histidine kinase KdpD
VLACLRGLYAALLALLIAFFTFDFLFVAPVYSFAASKLEDVVGLVVFFVTAVITSHLASALRVHAVEASRRERETRILYDVMRATNREQDMEHQLTVFVKAVVNVFATGGIRDCMFLLPGATGKLRSLGSATQILDRVQILPDEEATVAWVMSSARTLDLYHCFSSLDPSNDDISIQQPLQNESSTRYLIRLIPLKAELKVFGVLRLLIEDGMKDGTMNSLGVEHPSPSAQEMFFSTFLEQAVTVIEQGRLREASVDLEVLRKTEAQRSALFSSVSHGLRTPLVTIKAAATNLLQDRVQWEAEAFRSFALAIEREADRLDALVENLLDMSRIEAGNLRLEKEWYPLDELLHNVVTRMQSLLGERAVRMALPDDLPPVELDAVQIEQVIINILENAAHYTPQKSPLDISVQVQKGHMLVSSADRGPGIPLAESGRIFDKFYRLPGDGDAFCNLRGMGLGLAICQGIIDAHKGQIWVQMREGGGSIFCFTLPYRELEEGDMDE